MNGFPKQSYDGFALAMMSNIYFFELKNPILPSLKTIGNARVTAVVINEFSLPELLVHPDGKDPVFYCIDEVSFSPAISLAV
jgi:hypothetical protein